MCCCVLSAARENRLLRTFTSLPQRRSGADAAARLARPRARGARTLVERRDLALGQPPRPFCRPHARSRGLVHRPPSGGRGHVGPEPPDGAGAQQGVHRALLQATHAPAHPRRHRRRCLLVVGRRHVRQPRQEPGGSDERVSVQAARGLERAHQFPPRAPRFTGAAPALRTASRATTSAARSPR